MSSFHARLVASAFLLIAGMLPARVAFGQTPANWLGGTANWNTPANWSGGVVPNNGVPPGSTYDAFINVAGTYTVTMNSPITLTNLTLGNASAALLVSNTTLTMVNNMTLTAGALQLASATIAGGTISSGGGRITPNFSTSTLSGVSLGVNVLDMSAGRIALTNGTSFTGGPGTITLGGSSQIFIAQAATIPSGIVFALGSNSSLSADGFTATLDAVTTDTVTVNVVGSNAGLGAGFQGGSNNSVLINKGRVQFDPATVSALLNISAQGTNSRFRNEGKVVASSSGGANTINLSMGTITNAGTLTAATGGIINLNGTFARADLGTFTNTGGTINLAGTLNNTSLDLDNTTGSLIMSGGTIVGGTVSSTGTGRLRPTFTTGTLNGVSLGINVLDMSAGRIALTNGTNFTGGPGTITLGGSSQIFIAQAATIPSGIVFALGSNSSLSADGFTATLDAATTDTVTVNVVGSNAGLGAGFQGSSNDSILINKGRVQFDPATVNAVITISALGTNGRFRNEGKVVASSSGGANTINLSMATITNAGTLTAATGGTINLNTTFARADLGTFTNTGGTINLAGTLNNTSLDLDNTTGTLNMVNGTIVGGTVSATGTARLRPGFSTSTLNGVSLGVNVLDMSAGRIALTNGTSFTGGPGTITLGGSSQIFIAQAAAIPSGIVFALGSNSSLSADGNFTATLDAATTDTVTVNVVGSNAGLGAGFQGSSNDSILINKGRVQFDPATVNAVITISALGTNGRFRNEGKVVASSSGGANTINLSMATITNAGTLTAATGGTINLNTTFARADLGTFTNTGGTINLAGTLNNTSLDLDNTTGTLNMVSGTIVGGTVSAAGTARLKSTFNTSTLSGVSLGVNVLDMSAGRVALTNGTSFTGGPGTITLGGSSQIFIAQAAAIPSGIVFALGSNSSLSADGNFTATLDAATTDTVTVNVVGSNAGLGAGFQGSSNDSILINKGRVQFDPATVSAVLGISALGTNGRFRNEGKVVASSSGGANIINLSMATITNAGILTAATGGIINLNGTFTRADLGAFTNTGGAINLAGTLNNTGSSLDLNSTTGSFTLTAGVINGGTITATGAGRLLASSSASNTLDGVTMAFDAIDLSQPASRVRLSGGTTLTGAGTILLGNSSAVYLFQPEPIMSGINFALGSGSSLSAEGVTATLAASSPSILNARVAAGATATIGGGVLTGSANSILINQGTIDFAGTSSTLSVLSGGTGSRMQNDGVLAANTVGSNINFGGTTTFTNNGTLTASGGSVNIPASATFTNFNAGTLTGGTYQVFASSEINWNGRVITTVAANTTVLLSGASSVFTAANTINTNNGSVTFSNGRQHNVATFTNNGMLQVGTASGDLAKLTANVQVNNGGLVRGTGTIAGALTVAAGGTLAPGASPGILTVTGPITLNAGANFSVELSGAVAGSGYSQLNLTGGGSIDLNSATLVTNLGYAPAPGDVLTIITGGGVTNTFNGLPQGATVNLGVFMGTPYSATITYTGSTVLLSVPVPEPGVILTACACVGLTVAGVRRWRRQVRDR